MKKMMILILVSIFGWIGWKLGEKAGIMTAYFLGCIGSGIGLYLGSRINKMLSRPGEIPLPICYLKISAVESTVEGGHQCNSYTILI